MVRKVLMIDAMRTPEIVVLSRFAEIFQVFRESVDRQNPELDKIVIWDGTGTHIRSRKWTSHWTGKPFTPARNGNCGWKAVREDRDVLHCGDDVRLTEARTIRRLRSLAYSDKHLGVLSPRIVGEAQQVQMDPPDSPISYTGCVAFVMVYIKREVIRKVGYLDERFEGYGWEDFDYCYRVRQAGFKIGVARDVSVEHGFGGNKCSSTFRRFNTCENLQKQDAINRRKFAEKWGLPDDAGTIRAAMEAVRS